MTPTKSNKPTLFKAVEAAREFCQMMRGKRSLGDKYLFHHYTDFALEIEKALAALPDKPMTEDEIFKIIHQVIYHGFGSGVTTTKVIEALKAAGCLYVKED